MGEAGWQERGGAELERDGSAADSERMGYEGGALARLLPGSPGEGSLFCRVSLLSMIFHIGEAHALGPPSDTDLTPI